METQPQAYSQDWTLLDQEARGKKELEAEKQRRVSESVRLSISQKLILLAKGRVFLRYERREGWSKRLKIYAFRCPRHGIQTDYPHGYYERLDCPLCGYSNLGHQQGSGFDP